MRRSRASRIDVLLIGLTASIGGTERQICTLARNLQSMGLQIRVAFPLSSAREDFIPWCRDQGIEPELTPYIRSNTDEPTFKDVPRLFEYIRSVNPRIVNLHYGDNWVSVKDVIATRMFFPARCVVTVNHPTPWSISNRREKLKNAVAGLFAHNVVAISEATKRVVIESGIPRTKVRVIYCGVEPPVYSTSRVEARRQLGLPAEGFIVGSLGRLEPHKGNADIIHAVARTDPKKVAKLVIAGDGSQKQFLENLAEQELIGRASFLGRIDYADSLYAACDVFALPSLLEGFGLVYIEAAFHGIPSIGVNVAATPEVILDGVTGLLVSPNSPGEIAESLERLHDDIALRNRLGVAARHRAYTHFTGRSMAERYLEVFSSHLALARRG